MEKKFDTHLNLKNIIKKNYKKNIASIYCWEFIFYFFLRNIKQIKYINDDLQKGLVFLANKNEINTLEIQHAYMGKSHEGFCYPKLSVNLFTIPKKTIVYFDSKDINYPSHLIYKSEYEDISITNKKNIEFDLLIGSSPNMSKLTEYIISLFKNSNIRLALKLHPVESLFQLDKNIADKVKVFDGKYKFSKVAMKSLIYIPVSQHSTTVFDAYKCNCEIIIFNPLGRKFTNIPDNVKPIYCYSSDTLDNLVTNIIKFHSP